MIHIETSSGYWYPIIMLIAFIISWLIAYLIWRRGEKSYKKNTEEDDVFFAGNPPPQGELAHIKGNNLGWGFVEALDGFYNGMKRMHNGIINDYVGWFIGILAFVLIIIILWGGAI